MTARKPTRTPARSAVPPAPDDGGILDLLGRFEPGPTWRAARAILKGTFGLPMSDDEAEMFKGGTARSSLPTTPAREAWIIAGRRSGKSRIAALCVVFLAAIRPWRMAPGERPMVLLIAPSRRQAGVVLSYVTAMLDLLAGVAITRQTAEEIELSSGVTVRIESASFRTPRGFSIVGVIADEIAFFRDDSGANPDVEILRAVRPALASVPGSLLVAISTPYSTRGALFSTFERHYGRADSDILVWQSDSRTLNPTLPQRLIDQAMEDDPSSAASEWCGLFRSDLESLFSRAALDACTVGGRFELAPASGVPFVAFLDPSGGSADSFTLAIAHRDQQGRAILDLVRETRPPFSPEAVCAAFAGDIRKYGCRSVFSDAYGGIWPTAELAKYGVTVTMSELTRSEIYLNALPLVNSGACELLDNPRLLNQLAGLERRIGRSGRDSVDHQRGSHDDLGNAACGALVMAVRSIGLLAPLPSTFTECINSQATAAKHCPFLQRGAWWPTDSYCRAHCVGLRAILPQYEAHRTHATAAGDAPLNALDFLWKYVDLESSPLTSRIAWRVAAEQIDGLW